VGSSCLLRLGWLLDECVPGVTHVAPHNQTALSEVRREDIRGKVGAVLADRGECVHDLLPHFAVGVVPSVEEALEILREDVAVDAEQVHTELARLRVAMLQQEEDAAVRKVFVDCLRADVRRGLVEELHEVAQEGRGGLDELDDERDILDVREES